ncbi:MAG: PSD1 and planctomycete cytochrome C domain-containing protein [Gemmataceae bacterium]
MRFTLSSFLLAVSLPALAAEPTFDDIRPLLQAKCAKCHNEKSAKAELNLTTFAGLAKGSENGPVVVAGKAEKSPLYEQVHTGAMPPGDKSKLAPAEVKLLHNWIEAGAKPGKADVVAEQPLNQHDVIPIMLRRCTACHGRFLQEAKLDLRTKAAMLKGGQSGPAIVPGKPAESTLIKRITADQMPPPNRLVEACVKPVEPSELDTLSKWIAAGAPEASITPDVATTSPDPLVSDKDRDFWSFKPPVAAKPPAVKREAAVRNAIDNFLLKKLETRGLSFSAEAEKTTLLRRAHFDLTGLPPTPAEVKEFLGDTSPNAWEKVIDKLLASPRYGERWGRYWLDAAGYADSEGKREQDLPRPYAWRYRDYVVRSFNADKPYDRFLLEQLAGDELADYANAKEITPAIADNLVATAFLKMAPDATWANITGTIPDRIDVIADEIDVLGSAVMGLTLKCARCHTHKFDPIPHRDYYRLKAVFQGALDEYDWLKPDIRPGIGPESMDVQPPRFLNHVAATERNAYLAADAVFLKQIEAIRAPLEAKSNAIAAKLAEERILKLPAPLRDDLRSMLLTPAAQRNVIQTYLALKFESQLRPERAAIHQADPAFKKEQDAAEARIRSIDSQRPPEPKIQAVWDRGEPSPTYIYRRGDPNNTGKLVGPGVPSVLTDGKTPFDVQPPWPGAKSTGRRLAFAKWLTKPDHPLTARVAINRIWKHHFGTGIVSTLGNFGKTGSPPSHPELLDWLAVQFVKSGGSMKAMHRLIMTSAAYRQGSTLTPELAKADPANRLISRMPMTRLDAESLYDSLLFVAGKLDETRGGPADAVQVRKDGLVSPSGLRRMIYVKQTRKQVPTHLEAFDFPQMNPNCIERRDSTVAPQALHLLNNAAVEQLGADFAKRIRREAGNDPGRQILAVSLIALGRSPTTEEEKLARAALLQFADEWEAARPGDRDAAEFKALATYCHAVLNSAAFLYVD